MKEEAKSETMSYTLRNVSPTLDATMSAIASVQGKSKNSLIIETLEREFYNPITTFARSSMLVQAMDAEISKKFGIQILESWYESPHTIQYDRYLSQKLKLDSEEKLNDLFKQNFPFIELRAKQLINRGYPRLPKGISLTFALFIEIAKSSEQIIREIRHDLFGFSEHYYQEINEIRRALSLSLIPESAQHQK